MSQASIDKIRRIIEIYLNSDGESDTLLHQYLIEGGLKPKEAVKTTFQRTLAMPG